MVLASFSPHAALQAGGPKHYTLGPSGHCQWESGSPVLYTVFHRKLMICTRAGWKSKTTCFESMSINNVHNKINMY